MSMNPLMRLFAVVTIGAVIISVVTVGYGITHSEEKDQLSKFASEYQLVEFLSKQRLADSPGYFSEVPKSIDSELRQDVSESHSDTNVQVAGVDEMDIVKTDGEYVYAAANSYVTIIKAYPAEGLRNVSVIDLSAQFSNSNTTYVNVDGIFIGDDKLIAVTHVYSWSYWNDDNQTQGDDYGPKTIIAIYDTSDKENPSLAGFVGVSGHLLTARMIGNFVYAVSQASIWLQDDEIALPYEYEDGLKTEVNAMDIRFAPETPEGYSFVNVLSVNIHDGEHDLLTVVAGSASVVYMSKNSLYFTVQKYRNLAVVMAEDDSSSDPQSPRTTIYRIQVDALSMVASAKGEVNGWLLNQFSLDERDSYLRVATTIRWSEPGNAVYVLDDRMQVVGKLEGLAPSETIYASRFIGDTLYLVTFEFTDPLFVIDLSHPTYPVVVGELEMPGFSSYLHPVDEDHVLGIGMEGGVLKVSLYDVSNPRHPIEESKYLHDSAGWSSALHDHKAILFDLEKELLVIPAYSYSYNENVYEYQAGALVFNVSLTNGISLFGMVTHDSNNSFWGGTITRSLYIGEDLYTLSQSSIQANRLDDLSFVSSLDYASVMGFQWDSYVR